jgi:hypothetical protein
VVDIHHLKLHHLTHHHTPTPHTTTATTTPKSTTATTAAKIRPDRPLYYNYYALFILINAFKRIE